MALEQLRHAGRLPIILGRRPHMGQGEVLLLSFVIFVGFIIDFIIASSQ